MQYRVNGVASPPPLTGTSKAFPLPVGITVIDLVVTAQDPAYTKTFTITIQRAGFGANADLAQLDLSGLSKGLPVPVSASPPFDPATLDYAVTVPYAVSHLTVTAQTAGFQSWREHRITSAPFSPPVLSTGAPFSLTTALPVGVTTIDVRVTSPDLTMTKTTTMTVVRQAPNADLASLQLMDFSEGHLIPITLTPAFDPAVTA
ncbi:MAG: cadherin-like beta sandwich domain-containing protein [Chloroflexi bacterium]|nr:cadherin-like beta sandwich domain-containing protein [Chloroflexota bacterium]